MPLKRKLDCSEEENCNKRRNDTGSSSITMGTINEDSSSDVEIIGIFMNGEFVPENSNAESSEAVQIDNGDRQTDERQNQKSKETEFKNSSDDINMLAEVADSLRMANNTSNPNNDDEDDEVITLCDDYASEPDEENLNNQTTDDDDDDDTVPGDAAKEEDDTDDDNDDEGNDNGNPESRPDQSDGEGDNNPGNDSGVGHSNSGEGSNNQNERQNDQNNEENDQNNEEKDQNNEENDKNSEANDEDEEKATVVGDESEDSDVEDRNPEDEEEDLIRIKGYANAMLTRFDMKEEMEEGRFDEEGTFLWKKDQERDNWMDNIDWSKVSSSNQNTTTAAAETQNSDAASVYSCLENYRKILTFLKPKETIAKAIQRLGKGLKMSSLERLRAKKQGEPPSIIAARNSVKELTNLANQILCNENDLDVYQETYETISQKVVQDESVVSSSTAYKGQSMSSSRRAVTSSNGQPGTSSALDDKKAEEQLDMYADNFNDKEKERLDCPSKKFKPNEYHDKKKSQIKQISKPNFEPLHDLSSDDDDDCNVACDTKNVLQADDESMDDDDFVVGSTEQQDII